MILGDSNHRIFAWLAATVVILGFIIVGCSTTDSASGLQPRDSSLPAQADPPSAPGDPDSSSAGVESGQKLFATTGCAGCHTIDGKGGLAGPDLSNEGNKGRTHEWPATKIRNPKADNPQSIMPAYPTLSDEQINNLVDYMLSLKTASALTGATAARTVQGWRTASIVSSPVAAGGTTWSHRCGQCHNLRPPSEYSDAQWAVAMHHMRVRVPLTGEEQKDILLFLQASN
jgi:mono/diheme cytochrome c family protein